MVLRSVRECDICGSIGTIVVGIRIGIYPGVHEQLATIYKFVDLCYKCLETYGDKYRLESLSCEEGRSWCEEFTTR